MSVSSGIIECLLRLSGASKEISEQEFYRQMRKNAYRELQAAKSLPLFFKVKVDRGVYCGMNYLLFTPPEVDTKNCVMYLHGSGYMHGYQGFQLRFAADLAKNLHAKIFFPLYPKLPAATALECFSLLHNFYIFLRKKGDVCLVGDSSGGALALSLADKNDSITTVVAISPWVLLRVGEEGRKVTTDLVLSLSKLDYTAELWRGELVDSDPRVSPYYGSFEGKDILLFAGEKERFRPDVMKFFQEQSARGAKVTYFEGRGGQHCYPLMPTPEGVAARRVIYEKACGCLYGEKK